MICTFETSVLVSVSVLRLVVLLLVLKNWSCLHHWLQEGHIYMASKNLAPAFFKRIFWRSTLPNLEWSPENWLGKQLLLVVAAIWSLKFTVVTDTIQRADRR